MLVGGWFGIGIFRGVLGDLGGFDVPLMPLPIRLAYVMVISLGSGLTWKMTLEVYSGLFLAMISMVLFISWIFLLFVERLLVAFDILVSSSFILVIVSSVWVVSTSLVSSRALILFSREKYSSH